MPIPFVFVDSVSELLIVCAISTVIGFHKKAKDDSSDVIVVMQYRDPLSHLISIGNFRAGCCCNTPSEIRRTRPIFFSNTKILLESTNAMLVG